MAVLALGMVAAGALVITPATAAKFLTRKKADKRYINVGEKASDSDKLDGMDSTAFLGGDAKAADADTLDGIDSSGFVQQGQVPVEVEARAVDHDPTPVALTAAFQTVIDLESLHDGGGDQRITTTFDSILMATASLNIYTDSATASDGLCQLVIDGTVGNGARFDYPATNGWDVQVPLVGSKAVPAGTYEVDVQCREVTGSLTWDRGDLVVWAVRV
ncbi:MAG: hypothetical protein ACRDKA_03060 [Actinomycetota bacterium]